MNMIARTLLALTTAVTVSGATAAPPVPGIGAARPVAIELFTSQGCSSCPPADALAVKLSGDPSLVVISRPVTYWDRLGWKDTLARQANTDLQNAYAASKASDGVYTPQVVVAGRGATVGSRADQINALIAQARRRPGPSIAIQRNAAGMVDALVTGRGSGTVSVIAVKARVAVRIGSGENGGRQIVYANVLRAETALGGWTGGRQLVAIPAAARSVAGADRYALIVRQGRAGPILAARWL